MRLKIKNRSYRYDINRPRPRNGHKYTKYKMCLCIIIVIYIKQHLNIIWSSIQEKFIATLRLGWKNPLLIPAKLGMTSNCANTIAKQRL